MSTVQAPTRSDRAASGRRGRTIPLSEPVFRGNEWRYVKACLDSGWVSSAGPFVERFERAVAAYLRTAHAVAVVNGTAALHVALQVAGVESADEVLVPDLTFIAPVNAIRYCGAHPVLVDADPDTWQMDVDKVARFLSQRCERRRGGCYNAETGRRIRAILPVHLLGLACEMDRLLALAERYGLVVVEDAAEGIGVRFRGRHVGTFGAIGVLSFNGNKLITSGGGGMLATNHALLAKRARYLTTQAKDDPLEYIHKDVGYNYRLSSLQAALGVAQLEQLEARIAKKRTIAQAYAAAFRDVEGMTLMPTPPHTQPTYWLYTVLLPAGTTRAERQAAIRALGEAGFEARPLWHPIHGLPPYRECLTVDIEHAPSLYDRGISLPCSVGMRSEDVQRCALTLIEWLER